MKTNLIDNRQIRVFISSTFQDMQDERDYMMKRTFPKLRKLAAERDVTLTELDLRWGITEEEAKTGKVVEICLREIENSIPFFIGIIGNRYGWVPEKKDIGENVTERFKDVNNYLERHLSVTEMEMQFGVLQRKEDMHAYFYIMEGEEIENPDNPEMLERLKDEVQASKYPSSTYSSPEDLGIQVQQAFTTLLDQLFPEGHLSELEKERIGQRSFMNQLCQNYIKDEKNFQVLDEWMKDWEQHQMVVTGASGLGKSALIANWVKEKLSDKHSDYNIIYHFTGNGGSESHHEHIMKVLIAEINNAYGWQEEENPDKSPKVILDDLFLKVASEADKPLLIVLDAINQIIDTDNAKQLNWLPTPPRNIKILFSTLEDDRTMEVFRNRHYHEFVLQPISLEQRHQLVVKYLKDFGKKLTEAQIERVVTDKQCENTLVLKTLLDELINYGIFEKLDERIDYYLLPDTIEDFYQTLLRSYEEDFGKKYVCKILSLILISQYGLTEDELKTIAKVRKYIKWSQFYCSFINHFVQKNEKITFSHEYIRKAIYKRYIFNSKEWERQCRYNILLYRLKNRFNAASFLEIPFQLYELNEEEELFNYLSNLHTISYIYRAERQNVIRYWERLLSKGYSMDVYKTANDYFNDNQQKEIRMMGAAISFFKELGRPDLESMVAEKHLQVLMEDENVPVNIKVMALNNLGNAYYSLDLSSGKNEEYYYKSYQCFYKAIELAHTSNNNKELVVACNGLSNLFLRAKNAEQKVIDFSSLALDLSRKYCPTEIPSALNNLAQAYHKLKEWDKAIQYYLECTTTIKDTGGIYSEKHAVVNYNLALCYREKGQFENAYDTISEAIRILNEMYGNYHDMDSYLELQNEIKQHL